jgi:pyrroline-5-carboxylate reductase
MTYGFIGCGAMAGAIVEGCLNQKCMTADQIWICEKNQDLLNKRIQDWGVRGGVNYEECAAFADVVFLAVKPNIFPELLPEIGSLLFKYKRLAISVAAGVSLRRIESLLGARLPVVRVMPNLNVRVGEGITAICVNDPVSAEQKQLAVHLFNALGKTVELDENDIDLFSAIAGCGPAFVFLFIDSLARGAQKLGMNKARALRIAAQTVLGSAKNFLAQSDQHPWTLIDQVCSPGGSTIEGICALEARGFESAVVNAVEACAEKTKRMARKT